MRGVQSDIGTAAELLGAPEPRTYERLGARVWILGALMVVIGSVTAVLMLQDFRSDSYYYLAFYSIPSNTAIAIFPHEPALIYFGKFANLWITAAVAAAGTLVAGVMDHAVFVPVLNLKGLQGYKHKRLYRKAISAFLRWPFATLMVAGFSPIPFFPFKFLSFSIHYPLWKYLTAVVVSRFPRYYLLALLGAAFPIPNWIIIGSFLLIIALYAIKAGPQVWQRIRSGG